LLDFVRVFHRIYAVLCLIRSGCVCVRLSFAGWFMTHQLDVANRREIVARWCALAEQRLEHLTELFETGRWRRFHSEPAFLENLKEARAAVKTWRELSSREQSYDNSATDRSNLDPPKRVMARRKTWRDPAELLWSTRFPADKPPEKAPEKPADKLTEQLTGHSAVPGTGDLHMETPLFAPAREHRTTDPVAELTATIAQRYPLLRNRF
jgi:uncharacterized repeat protein (TIGR03809 family)